MKSFFGGVKKLSENSDENSDESTDVNNETHEDSSTSDRDEQANNESSESSTEMSHDEESTDADTDELNEDNSSTDIIEQITIPEPIDGPRYSIGIDLGTTHCVLSYVDISDPDADEIVQQVLDIPQLTAPGVIEDKAQLPSFLYQAHEAEISDGETALPWAAEPEYLVGEIARNWRGWT